MPAFSTDATTQHPHDFVIARAGGVAAYLRNDVLVESERTLDAAGYSRIELDASEWDERRLHQDMRSALGFPDDYGKNMSALDDCLGDVACGDYGWDTAQTGLAVTLRGFGPFTRRDPDLAHAFVERLVGASREALLFGHRLLWLLHVDDPDFRMDHVGAGPIAWNSREWLDADRRRGR